MDERGGHSVGVELAGPGHQHGPRHAAQEAQHVGVDPSTCTHDSVTAQQITADHSRSQHITADQSEGTTEEHVEKRTFGP